MLPHALQSAWRGAAVNFDHGIRIQLRGADADELVTELKADATCEPQATHRLALEAAVLAAAALGTEDLGQMQVLDGLVMAAAAALRGGPVERTRWRSIVGEQVRIHAERLKNAERTAEKRRKKSSARKRELKLAFDKLYAEADHSLTDKEASANAIRTLATQENVQPERMQRLVHPRQRVKEARKRCLT
jgi:hypothetical protein